MTLNAESNISSISTTSRWILDRQSPPRRGTGSRPQGVHPGSWRNRRTWWKRGQLIIEFKGGAECSYLLKMNGLTWRYAGHDSLHDVMSHFARVAL